MGLCQSELTQQQLADNRKIDQSIANAMIEDARTVKMLLLGSGESGKTTILKQIKLLQESGFSNEEVDGQQKVVYANTIDAMLALLNGIDLLGIHIEDTEHKSQARLLRDLDGDKNIETFTDDVASAIAALWADRDVLEAYSRRHEFSLPDSAAYFLESLERIREPAYRPSVQDMLKTRAKTTGVTQLNFAMRNMDFQVVDVGSQRSERRKWIHCFDNCTAVVFILAMSEYDQTLAEDSTVNRMVEATKLYKSILNNHFFTKAAMILFLNKRDLFEEKLKKVSIRCLFDDYQGGQEYEESFAFIQTKLAALKRDPGKLVYTHRTCATDTDQMKQILTSYPVKAAREMYVRCVAIEDKTVPAWWTRSWFAMPPN